MIFSDPTGDALISQDGAVSFSADYVTTNATWVVMEDYDNDMHVTACYIQHATSLHYLGCDDSEKFICRAWTAEGDDGLEDSYTWT